MTSWTRVPHALDVQTMERVREKLRTMREDQDLSYAELGRRMGRHSTFAKVMEQGIAPSPKVSSWQVWAGSLGARIEFGIEDFWLFAHVDIEMAQLYQQSRAWGADAEMRLWLVAALRQWRVKRGLDVEVVGALLQSTGENIREWEAKSRDPFVARAMWQARVTGTAVTMRVFTDVQEWQFG